MNASKKKILIAVIAVILVAALGVGAYFLFFRGDKAPADGDKSPDATDGVQDAELTDLQQLLRIQEETVTWRAFRIVRGEWVFRTFRIRAS